MSSSASVRAVFVCALASLMACAADETVSGEQGDCRNVALSCSAGFECVLVPTDGLWACVPEDKSGSPAFSVDASSGAIKDTGTDAGGWSEPDIVEDTGGPVVVDTAVVDSGPTVGTDTGSVDVTPDAPPPPLTVALKLPGPYLTGVALVEATVAGPSGILGVEFQVDGLPVYTDLIPPYMTAIDTLAWEPGTHMIRATTASADGQTKSAEASAIFDNAPPVIVSFLPVPGATLFFEDGPIELAAEVTDATPIASVRFRVNGLLVGEAFEAPWTASVDPSTLLLTPAQLPKALDVMVEAVDAQGQESEATHSIVVHRRLSWSKELAGEVWAPVAALGSALVATTVNGHVEGLTPDGGSAFSLDLQKELAGGVVVDSGAGRFFVCGSDGYVRAYEAWGGDAWGVNVGGSCGGTPAVHEGLVIAPVMGGDVVALAVSDGGQQWKASLPGLISASPAVGPDGTVYVGSQDGSLYAIKGGTVAWSHPTGGEIWSRPALDPVTELIYTGSNTGWVHALTSDGEAEWQAEVKGQVWGALLAPGDGSVYVASTFKQVYRLNADDGTVEWTTKLGGISYSSPVIDGDGTLYVGSTTGVLHALDAATGAERFAYPVGASLHATPVISGDRVVVGCVDKSVYALWRYGVSLP